MPELPIAIADYFTYHPVRTPARQAAHDLSDRECRKLFDDLSSILLSDREKRSALTVFGSRIADYRYCRDKESIAGALDIISYLKDCIFNGAAKAVDLPIEERKPAMLMRWILYLRSNLTQGATIDELLSIVE
jgi:hypothetical protein